MLDVPLLLLLVSILMKALVLCAGYGTRLRPLSERIAKPALPVVGIPTLWYSIWSILRDLQPEKWFVNVGHAADTVHTAVDLPELKNFARISVEFSDESSEVLGSSGALWKIKNRVGSDRLLVVNGDSICFAPWRKMLDFHLARKALLTMHVRSFESSESYTNVILDSKGLVTGFGEKTQKGTMFSGAYIIEPSVLERLPIGVSQLKSTILDPLAQEGGLFAYKEDCEWFDTGTVGAFFSSQFSVPTKLRAARPLIETMMTEASPGVWLPKSWGASRKSRIAFKTPVVCVGRAENWENANGVLGPRFCGITDYLGIASSETDFEKAERSQSLLFMNQSYTFK